MMLRLLTFTLLVIIVSARRYDYQQDDRHNGRNQGRGGRQESQGWGGQQGNQGWGGQQQQPWQPQYGPDLNRPSFGGHGHNSFESHEFGSFERPDFGSHGSHESPFPGWHGFPGPRPGGHHFFPIFKNITREARMELMKIMMNRTLTKAEMEAALKAWATEQGADVEKQLNDMLEKKKKLKEDVKAKINEVLEEIKTAIAKIEEIKDNMAITKAEEKKQIFELFRNMSRSIPKIIGLVTKTAMKKLVPTPELPTVLPPIDPSAIPTIQP